MSQLIVSVFTNHLFLQIADSSMAFVLTAAPYRVSRKVLLNNTITASAFHSFSLLVTPALVFELLLAKMLYFRGNLEITTRSPSARDLYVE